MSAEEEKWKRRAKLLADELRRIRHELHKMHTTERTICPDHAERLDVDGKCPACQRGDTDYV
jgi:hypothetical protein